MASISTPGVSFGEPLAGPVSHWQTIADHVRKHPGMWVPVHIDGFTRQQNYVTAFRIKTGYFKTFASLEYTAKVQGGELYVQWSGPKPHSEPGNGVRFSRPSKSLQARNLLR